MTRCVTLAIYIPKNSTAFHHFQQNFMTQILHYPKRNRIGIEPTWTERRLTIIERIDLRKCPLSIDDYLRRPMVRRGRWLLKCWDHNTQKFRQFYENSFREYWFPEPLKIGEIKNGKIRQLSDPFQPQWDDCKKLEIMLQRLKGHQLVVYSDGLRLL